METSKDYKNYVLHILLIGIIVLLLFKTRQGRYALSATHGPLVLDTRTGELWERSGSDIVYYGTPKNPRYVIDRRIEVEYIPPRRGATDLIPQSVWDNLAAIDRAERLDQQNDEDIDKRPRFEDLLPADPNIDKRPRFEDLLPADPNHE